MAHAKPAGKPDQEQPAELESANLDNLEALAGEDAANDYQPGQADHPDKEKAMGSEELQKLYFMVFALASTRLGSHWVLSQQESEELAKATDAVLEKYGAKMAMGPEITLMFTAGLITVPRALISMQTAKTKPESEQETETGKEQSGEAVADGG